MGELLVAHKQHLVGSSWPRSHTFTLWNLASPLVMQIWQTMQQRTAANANALNSNNGRALKSLHTNQQMVRLPTSQGFVIQTAFITEDLNQFLTLEYR